MKRLIIFMLLFAAIKVAGQTTGYLRFDTVKIMKQNGTAELYIINATKDSLGILTNIGGGLTRFYKPRVLNDSTFTVGRDTLVIRGGIGGPGSGGNDNANVGTGYAWLKPGTQEIKRLFPGYGFLADSTTNANSITIRADTSGANGLVTRTELRDSTDLETFVEKPLRVRPGANNSIPDTISLESFKNYDELRAVTHVDTAVVYRLITDKQLGDFYYDPSDITSADDTAMVIVTTGGARLKRFYNDRVYVTWFGAKAGDGLDDWWSLQKAINFVIANNDRTKMVVFDDLGIYNLSMPLLCFNWTGTDYTQFQIKLVGAISGKMALAYNMVQLSHSWNDKPVIVLHKARASSIENILMIGNYAHGLTQKQAWEGRRSLWRNGTGRDEIYSPYTGIAIDPFRYAVTDDGGYPDLTGYYRGSTSNGGSSGITIKNCYITNFTVGVSVSLNTTTLNADNVDVLDCRIETCMSAIAYGQAQTKGNFVKNLVSWGITHTVIDCANYGLRDGYPPIIDGINIANTTHQIIDQRTNQAVPVVMSNIFAEGLFKIGRIASLRTHVIRDSEIRFAQNNANIADADRVLVASNVIFDGCALSLFTSANGGDSLRLNFSGQPFTFRSCVFNQPPITADNADATLTQRASFFNCRGVLYGTFGNVSGQSHGINSTTKNTPLAGYETETGGGATGMTNKFRFSEPLDVMVSIGDRDVILDTVTRTAKIVMSGLTGLVQRGDYIFSTFSSSMKDTTLYGDVDKNPCIGRVTSVTADTIYTDHVAVSVRLNGTRSLYMNYYRKIGSLFTGDVTNGSDTIRNVEVYNNFYPVAGDRFEVTGGMDAGQWSQGSFITYVDAAGGKIAVSKAFTSTKSHVDFFMGNPRVTVRAYNSPEATAGSVFHFNGAEWNVTTNSGTDSVAHRYAILRSGPYNSTFHPHKSVKVWPGGDLSQLNISTKNIFVSDANYTVANADWSITYNSATTGRTITLPAVATNNKRVLIINNPTAQNLTTSISIRQNSATTSTTIPDSTTLIIACDGSEWREILRTDYTVGAAGGGATYTGGTGVTLTGSSFGLGALTANTTVDNAATHTFRLGNGSTGFLQMTTAGDFVINGTSSGGYDLNIVGLWAATSGVYSMNFNGSTFVYSATNQPIQVRLTGGTTPRRWDINVDNGMFAINPGASYSSANFRIRDFAGATLLNILADNKVMSYNGLIPASASYQLMTHNSDSTIGQIASNTFLLSSQLSDVAYNESTWNTNTDAPTKNAVRDQIELMKSRPWSATHTYTVTTSDATPTNLTAVYGAMDIPDASTGWIKVVLTGNASNGATTHGLKGIKYYSFNKAGGTLTLDAADVIVADKKGASVTTATWQLTISSNQPVIEVTGIAGTMRWAAAVEVIYIID